MTIPRYKKGDTVYRIQNGKIIECEVLGFLTTFYNVFYDTNTYYKIYYQLDYVFTNNFKDVKDNMFEEGLLFPSKEELIASL